MSTFPVTLQISLAPSDFAHAQHLLAHQVRAWQGQFDELLLTVDLHRSAGRFSARWEEGCAHILPLARSFPQARTVIVDYDADGRQRVASEFFGGHRVPEKDHRGGPFYAYFFALAEARHDHVLHVDSDLFFGGGSRTWIEEALAAEAALPDVLFQAPLPGPPHAGGQLLSQQAEREPEQNLAFRFSSMSTRLFLVSRSRLRQRIGALHRRRPPLRQSLIALLEGNPREDLPEHLFTSAMRARGLVRREFLGRPPGMWSLHPPYRCADFYARLPELIQRIESGDVPDAQRGHHDIGDAMVDWSEARAALGRNRLWHRLLRRP